MDEIILQGCLGGDPEGKDVGESQVANFSVACDRGKDRDGNKRDPAWYRIDAWQHNAKTIMDWFSKGKPILIRGTLKAKPRAYINKAGEPASSYEVRADRIWFINGAGRQTEVMPDAGALREDAAPF